MVTVHSLDDAGEYYCTKLCKENANETLEEADQCWFNIKSKEIAIYCRNI